MATTRQLVLAWTLWMIASASRAQPAAPAVAAPETLSFRVTTFATATRMPGPIAFTVDDRGVVYTANTQRMGGHGLFDVRQYRDILPDDWRLTTVDERRAAMKRWVRTGLVDHGDEKLTLESLAHWSEQVRRFVDRDGDGVADDATVFAGGMNELERGPAAGVLAWDGNVYATIIPELLAWRDSAGHAAGKRVLEDGFGVHMGQGGHDMHGLTMGLDGRLYWSIGDRGFSFTTREGRTLAGHEGAVFRCWPDGRGLELFARGLRNPQELAFDDHGDLFTGDNNADVGDRSRWLYLPEGADAGWSYSLQFARSCGPWLREHHWEPAFEPGDPAQPAWVLHPVAETGSCPAGLAAYPGTGLPARYAGTMWLADFVGGVDAYRFEPDGAGFQLAETLPGYHDSWGTCDVDFAPDGRVFVLYWGESWRPNDKARLLALTPLERADSTRVQEVKTILARGVRALARDSLATLLAHPDRRLRQRASFELARRGDVATLAGVLAADPDNRSRLHALWALGIIGHARGAERVLAPVTAALEQRDPEVRRLAATVLGELGVPAAGPRLVQTLADSSPRVRFAAAQALARVGDAGARAALTTELARNADRDPLLRFACARALGRVTDAAALAALREHPDRSVRLGAVLALRETGSDSLAAFLDDADPQVAIEAARAAYDRDAVGACRALAAMLPPARPELATEPWLRRALHAALRSGRAEDALAVARFVADSATTDEWREEGLRVLLQWDTPDPRDGVWGRWAPCPPRAAGLAHAAVLATLDRIFATVRGDGLALALDLAEHEKVRITNETFLRWVGDETLDDGLRVTALGWLRARRAPEVAAAERAALRSSSDTLFLAAVRDLYPRAPRVALAAVDRVLQSRTTPLAVRQAAVRSLAWSDAPEAVGRLTSLWHDYTSGKLDPDLALDVRESACGTADRELRCTARAELSAAAMRGVLERFRDALHGGDVARGQRVFEGQPAAGCLRCHVMDGRGGSTGPDLSMIGAHDRRDLLQALVDPSARLAPGYPATTMPAMGGVLSDFELRDLIEFLATRRDESPDNSLASRTEARTRGRFDCVAVDHACTGRPLSVAGHELPRGVGVIAPSRLAYVIPPGSRAFVGLAGVDDASRAGEVEFLVSVDGRPAWRSGPVRVGRKLRIHVPLAPGAARLELAVLGTGGGSLHAHADWLEAGFVRE